MGALDSTLKRILPDRIYDILKVAKALARADRHEPEVRAAIMREVKPGATCVDVGANIGIFTRLLARQAGGQGKVVAFEAFPGNARLLQRLNALYGYGDRIRVENVAINDGSDKEVWLYPGRESSREEWNIMGSDLEEQKTEAVLRLPATSLDDYFPPGAPVDFIKLDIEGAEWLALAGMVRILKEARPVMLIEFHDEQGWSGRKHLFDAGYRLTDLAGNPVDPAQPERVYHCLCFPPGR